MRVSSPGYRVSMNKENRELADRKKNLIKDEKGAVAVLIAVLLTVLMGFAALVIDVGSVYQERRREQNASDAAALAGVQELPKDPAAAEAIAEEYVNRNNQAASEKVIGVSDTFIANDTVSVSLSNSGSPLYFARLLGVDSAQVGAIATAVVVSPTAYGYGVMPFGVMATNEAAAEGSTFGYEFGQLVTLKQPAGEGSSGNYHIVALNEDSSKSGAGFIYDSVAGGGVPNPVNKGSEFFTKTGTDGTKLTGSLNSWIDGDSHTFADISINKYGLINIKGHDEPTACHRLIVVPVIVNPEYPEGDPLRYNWPSGSKSIQVVDFAYFFVENVGTQGMNSYIDGRFVRVVGEDRASGYGEVSPTGAVVFRLID